MDNKLRELKKYINLPIAISNDANCAALGEVLAGAAKECQNTVLLTLGTGVGSGIIIDGKIFEGGHFGGAEFGHTVIVSDGEECTCGRKGCFEAYASATALIRNMKRAILDNPNCLMSHLCQNDLDKVNGELAFEAMKQGDEVAKVVVENYMKYLSIGIVNLVNIFRPDKVLIGGEVCNQGKLLTEGINEYIRENCFGGAMVFVSEVQMAELENDAGIIGAAGLYVY